MEFNGHHFGYDQLILATGSGSTYFGREEWRPLAPPMKILEHADEIRRRLLMALEEAEQTRDPERRRFLQSVVVVGAGPAGCELAGSLIELMQRAIRRDFKQLDPPSARCCWWMRWIGCCPPCTRSWPPPPPGIWKRPA